MPFEQTYQPGAAEIEQPTETARPSLDRPDAACKLAPMTAQQTAQPEPLTASGPFAALADVEFHDRPRGRHPAFDPFGGYEHARPVLAPPAVIRTIARNVSDLAAMLADIEPEQMNRPELLSLLGVLSSSAELSAALLVSVADRIDAEQVAR